MVMLHGRGASASHILELVSWLDRPTFTYLAPDAAGHSWYPFSFMSDTRQNEPGLTSALAGRRASRLGSRRPRHLGRSADPARLLAGRVPLDRIRGAAPAQVRWRDGAERRAHRGARHDMVRVGHVRRGAGISWLQRRGRAHSRRARQRKRGRVRQDGRVGDDAFLSGHGPSHQRGRGGHGALGHGRRAVGAGAPDAHSM